MLTATGTACAMTAAIVAVGMLVTVLMEMVMVVRMGMTMLMAMGMLVGVGNTVMGVLMGMGMLMVMGMTAGNMIVMDVHGNSPLRFFFIIAAEGLSVKVFYIFVSISPTGACGKGRKEV